MLRLLVGIGIILGGLILTFPAANSTSTTADTYNIFKGPTISKPGCPTKCGNLTVPYPFGISNGCAMEYWFEFACKSDSDTPGAFLSGSTIQIYEISDNHMRVSNDVARTCYYRGGLAVKSGKLSNTSSHIIGTPFSYSELNKFTVVGCDDSGTAKISMPTNFITGCEAFCRRKEDVVGGHCSGKGCCQTSMPKSPQSYSVELSSWRNHTDVSSFNWCGYAFLGEEERFVFRGVPDLSDPNFMQRVRTTVPIVLDWAIGNLTCAEAQKSKDYACKANSNCVDSNRELGGYRCSCSEGYEGNPYLDPGCTDIDECADPNLNDCEKNYCINTPGSFNCACPSGQYGDARRNGQGCIVVIAYNSDHFLVIKVALGIGSGFLSIAITVTWLYLFIKKRKLLRLREKFFRRNGGFFLKQQISLIGGSTELTKIFTAEELEKATDSYADDRILGRGGHGTVYKGVLPDKRIVAIKKASELDESQIEQFINEVVILTRINHRNVVKLLGCCFESEVPLLVYEYVSNGTLFEHIHHRRAMNWLSWENRLRIASEAAGALSYLHSAASIPIIHRDVKSPNILLDEYFTAKVSDFGASRLFPLDKTKVTTMVVGTFGYMDPEYYHTSQLTEKSDVYSFGVVLAELMTGGKPIDMERSKDQRNLTAYFIMSMKENRLFQILEPRVVKEASLEELRATAELIKRCLHVNREDRPTMREVAMELEELRKLTKNSWTNQPVDEESVRLTNETGAADLYAVSISPSASTGEFYASSTI